MPYVAGQITRCDIRIPNELYERIEALAVENKARINHRSGKPEVTGTILELLEIGLKYRLSDNLPDRLSDTVSDSGDRLEGEDRAKKLSEDELLPIFERFLETKGIYQTTPEQVSDSISDETLTPIIERILESRGLGSLPSTGLDKELLTLIITPIIEKIVSDHLDNLPDSYLYDLAQRLKEYLPSLFNLDGYLDNIETRLLPTIKRLIEINSDHYVGMINDLIAQQIELEGNVRNTQQETDKAINGIGSDVAVNQERLSHQFKLLDEIQSELKNHSDRLNDHETMINKLIDDQKKLASDYEDLDDRTYNMAARMNTYDTFLASVSEPDQPSGSDLMECTTVGQTEPEDQTNLSKDAYSEIEPQDGLNQLDEGSQGQEIKPSPIDKNLGLTGVELATRLGDMPKTTLSSWNKNNVKLAKKTKEKDPDGLSWKFSPKDKKYYPIGSSSPI